MIILKMISHIAVDGMENLIAVNAEIGVFIGIANNKVKKSGGVGRRHIDVIQINLQIQI